MNDNESIIKNKINSNKITQSKYTGVCITLMISMERKILHLIYAGGLRIQCQVCYLGVVIQKSSKVDVSTRQHTDKRIGWLRPNYTHNRDSQT